jgi:acetylornithine deacetylase/succinyl-diaminopimelate desuccinylase-like protein
MNVVSRIAGNEQVQQAVRAFDDRVAGAVELAVTIQQIPAPTFHEGKRADFVQARFFDLGLADVEQDDIHNVYGRLPGRDAGRLPVIISAHSDTVFAEDTDLTIHRANGPAAGNGHRSALISGPGLADNSMGVAGLLVLAETMQRFNLQPVADIWFVCNVGEEGLGDLKGMRSVVSRFGRTAAYIIVEGGSYGHIFHAAVGVRRFRVTVKTAGGHSWGNFGSPNAIHALGRFIAAIDNLVVPEKPKTTYNIGVIEGGTTVNSIASEASLLLDLRSAGPAELAQLVDEVQKLTADLNRLPGVSVEITQIGSRPAGELSPDTPLVLWATDALRQVGCDQLSLLAGSTDANIPISQGFPAVCIGLAKAGNTHRLDEYLDPTHLSKGLGQLLLLSLAAADF